VLIPPCGLDDNIGIQQPVQIWDKISNSPTDTSSPIQLKWKHREEGSASQPKLDHSTGHQLAAIQKLEIEYLAVMMHIMYFYQYPSSIKKADEHQRPESYHDCGLRRWGRKRKTVSERHKSFGYQREVFDGLLEIGLGSDNMARVLALKALADWHRLGLSDKFLSDKFWRRDDRGVWFEFNSEIALDKMYSRIFEYYILALGQEKFNQILQSKAAFNAQDLQPGALELMDILYYEGQGYTFRARGDGVIDKRTRALRLYFQVFNEYTRLLGPFDSKTMRCLWDLAISLREEANADAEQYFRLLYLYQREIHGDDHIQTRKAVACLADSLVHNGNMVQAGRLLWRSLTRTSVQEKAPEMMIRSAWEAWQRDCGGWRDCPLIHPDEHLYYFSAFRVFNRQGLPKTRP
jgi:hypothetical protein